MRTTTAPFTIAAILATATSLLISAHAGAAPVQAPRECLSRFAAALTSGNAAAVKAECSDAVWARIAQDVNGAGLGTFDVLPQSVGVLREGLAAGRLVWTHPDGVQDLLDVTLGADGDSWRIAGGLGGATSARPLQR